MPLPKQRSTFSCARSCSVDPATWRFLLVQTPDPGDGSRSILPSPDCPSQSGAVVPGCGLRVIRAARRRIRRILLTPEAERLLRSAVGIAEQDAFALGHDVIGRPRRHHEDIVRLESKM